MKDKSISPLSAFFCKVIFLLACLVSMGLILSNLQSTGKFLVGLTAVAVLSAKLFFPRQTKAVLTYLNKALTAINSHDKSCLLFCFVITLSGLSLRLFFFFAFSYNPLGDPSHFFDAAAAISSGAGIAGDMNIATFPHLAAYSNLLALSMRIINEPWLATIILNSIFDIIAAALAYLFVKNIAGESKSFAPLAAFTLWFLSPFGILYAVISLPIIIVNFFIILALFLAQILYQKLSGGNTKNTLILAALLGLTLGLANCFRPVFTILLLAISFGFALMLLSAGRLKKSFLLAGTGLIIAGGLFFGVQRMNLLVVSAQTQIKTLSYSGGWSVFVGANNEYNGTWNVADDYELKTMIAEMDNDLKAVHGRLMQEGIKRYQELGVRGAFYLFAKKLNIFSTAQGNMYNVHESVSGYQFSAPAKVFFNYIIAFILGLFTASAACLYRSAGILAKEKKIANPEVLIIALALLGWYVSIVFVETSFRYAQVLYPLFIILAVLLLDNADKEK